MLKEVSDRLTVKEGAVIAFGFSQGAQAAAEVAIRYPQKYAGAIILLPGGLPRPQASAFQPLPGGPPGIHRRLWGRRSARQRGVYRRVRPAGQGGGARVQHKPYPGMTQHTLPPDYWDVLPNWIRFILDSRTP